MLDTYLWEEKYRPTKLDDLIVPDEVKKEFQKYLHDGQFPNLLLSSASPGTGKTTTARVLCEELGIRPLFINASLENSIDDIRTKIPQYATTMSLSGGTKAVILDEADRLSPAAQDSLKGIIELVHKNCRFIMTCNTRARMIDPIQSRLTEIEYVFSGKDKKMVSARMFKRACEILEVEGVEYKKEIVAKVVAKFSPDNRKILNALQHYSAKYGAVDEGILGQLAAADVSSLITAMKERNYGNAKTWVFENVDRLQDDWYGRLFATIEPLLEPQSVPEAVLILGQEQKYHSTVPDRFIHFLALVTQLMMTVKFK